MALKLSAEVTEVLELAQPEPTETHPTITNPAERYLAELSEGKSRATMLCTLRAVAGLFNSTIAECAWHELGYDEIMTLRAYWQAKGYKPATINRSLSCLRGVAKQAFDRGQMTSDQYLRAIAVKNVRGSRLLAGRALDSDEISALWAACDDGTAIGARDAAIVALMYGCGLRRAEAVTARMEDYDADTGELRIVGKGNKQRTVHAGNTSKAALATWISIRGNAAGPIIAPVIKGQRVRGGKGIAPEIALRRIKHRAKQAGIKACTAHDMRRTFVTTSLDLSGDLASVQKLAGHSKPETTVRYDRRGADAARQVALMLP